MTGAAPSLPSTDDPIMWHRIVAIGFVVLIGIACFGGDMLSIVLGIAGVLLIAAAYVLFGRTVLREQRPSMPFQILTVIGTGVAVLGSEPLAAAQGLAAPLLWLGAAESTRRAVLANLALFAVVLLAFVSSGAFIWLLVAIQALGFGFSMVMGSWITSLASANAERARLIAELELAQASIARLSGEQATAAERARIARDLHDTIAQDLTAIAMLAQRRALDDDGRRAVEQLAQDALAEVRGMAAAHGGIRLDDGLSVALEHLGARFQAETGVAVSVDARPLELTVDAEVALLRTAQEALANVRKHAAATHVMVTMTADASGAVLEITDDGRGFDRSTVTRGLGLQGLDDRMALAGGSLDIRSSQEGTTVIARLTAEPRAGAVAQDDRSSGSTA